MSPEAKEKVDRAFLANAIHESNLSVQLFVSGYNQGLIAPQLHEITGDITETDAFDALTPQHTHI